MSMVATKALELEGVPIPNDAISMSDASAGPGGALAGDDFFRGSVQKCKAEGRDCHMACNLHKRILYFYSHTTCDKDCFGLDMIYASSSHTYSLKKPMCCEL